MLPQAAEITRAFEELAIARQPTFVQLVPGGRLRYSGIGDGTCDVVDDYSSRLICECITARSALLMVWPDKADRRGPLALAAAVVCDSVLRMRGDSARGRILYVGSDASIREQFVSVRVGSTALSGVFAQEYGRGDSQLHRVGPESSLPVVTTIVSPAEPHKIIKALHPRWIAVDCGRGNAPPWLPGLLVAAKAHGVPVIGWSALHLSPVAELWRAQGGCVYRWPKASGASRIASLDELGGDGGSTDVSPMILDGQRSVEVSEQLAQCYQRLARHAGRAQGQLARDALSVAWRYLRLLESLPVPIDLYDVECVNYWGMPALSRLKGTLERFVQALDGDGGLRSDLAFAHERLAAAHGILREQGDPPLWLAASNLAVGADVRSLFVFQSRAHRDLFRFSLLSKFNISEKDLQGVGVSLAALSELSRLNRANGSDQVTMVGLPSRAAEWRMESLLEYGELRAIVWPHLEDVLQRRATEWSGKLSGSCDGPSPLRLAAGTARAGKARVRVVSSQTIKVGDMTPGVAPTASGPMVLWKRPDAAEAIRALFAAQDVEDDAGEDSAAFAPVQEGADGAARPGQDDWIEDALRVVFDDGGQILLPLDDYVNVIVRRPDGVNVEPRYSRSLRTGDEILLVHGEHRRGLYDLLVSRVHSHSKIAPWLTLIDHWHQDLRRAFLESKRRSGTTFESVLEELRKHGSTITTAASVRGWIVGVTLAPSDWEDIRRLGDILDIAIAKEHPREIGNAAGRLAGLHRSLSIRLNRWLASEDAGVAALSGEQSVVDAELGLTIEDFRHSLVRGRIASVAQVHGPFLRAHIGKLRRNA